MKKKKLILPFGISVLATMTFCAAVLQKSKSPILLNVEALSQDESTSYGMHPEPWGEECIFVDAKGDSVYGRRSKCLPTSDLLQTCTDNICMQPY